MNHHGSCLTCALVLLLGSMMACSARRPPPPTTTSATYDVFTAVLPSPDDAAAAASSPEFEIVRGQVTPGACWAWFVDRIDENGWAELHLASNASLTDDQQINACGYLEGYITQLRIYQSITNIHLSAKTASPQLLKWLHANEAYNLQQHEAHPDDLFWAHVRLNLLHYKALFRGYNASAPTDQQLTEEDFMLLQADEESDDVQNVLNRVWETAPYSKMSGAELFQDMTIHEHCSALIKPTADMSDILIAHNTWGRITRLLRVMKSYHLYLQGVASTGVMWPGYFGVLMCGDDIYVTDETKLAVTETSNSILNQSMWSRLTPESVLYWQRVIVANRLAHNGKEWANLFGIQQSGTYNNQWMVVDMKLFLEGKGSIKPNTLWVIEGAPGMYHAEDKSDALQNGWWPSFNRPYFQDIYEVTGYTAVAAKWGDMFSYQKNPRANIFRRDAGQVNDLQSMEAFITSNSYQTDPFSYSYPGNAVAGRFDFKGGPSTGTPYDGWFSLGLHGARDSKVISALANVGHMAMSALNGPPHNSQCPVFQWSGSQWENVTHVGVPDRIDFPWVDFNFNTPL